VTASDPPEAQELDQVAAWRLRLLDADTSDQISAAAVGRLESLASDLRRDSDGPLWTELRAICHWLSESGAIEDYAALAAAYRQRIGVSEQPKDGAAYLAGLLSIARGLV
jgi:hypothetical protein